MTDYVLVCEYHDSELEPTDPYSSIGTLIGNEKQTRWSIDRATWMCQKYMALVAEKKTTLGLSLLDNEWDNEEYVAWSLRQTERCRDSWKIKESK